MTLNAIFVSAKVKINKIVGAKEIYSRIIMLVHEHKFNYRIWAIL